MRAVFIQMVYDKALLLQSTEGKQGDAVTLVASDSNRMRWFFTQCHYLWYVSFLALVLQQLDHLEPSQPSWLKPLWCPSSFS